MTVPRFVSVLTCSAVAAAAIAVAADAASQDGSPATALSADQVLAAYVDAIGGQRAIDAVQTRTTRGLVDNGRAFVQPFVTYAKHPDRIVTIIGRWKPEEPRGSVRGFDGQQGWDKNVLGTELRSVSGPELAALTRTADLFRPVHLPQLCDSIAVDVRGGSESRLHVVRCTLPDTNEEWFFDANTGLLARCLSFVPSTGLRVTTTFEDYRPADGLRVPFRTRMALPGAVLTFAATSVRHNEPIDEALFKPPVR